LKIVSNLTASQRKNLATEMVATDFFLALIISGIIENEKARLKTFMGFDTDLYQDLMFLIALHPKMKNSPKKILMEIENHIFNWLTTSKSVTHHEIYSAFCF
jgi:hypothetical protein